MIVMDKINCCIISIYPFPNGMAATNRMLAYSKGLVENGANVDILITIPCFRPSNENIDNSGTFQGVNYTYTVGKFTSKFKIFRAISIISSYRKVSGIYCTIKEILKKHRINKYDVFIISTDNILDLYVYSKISRIIKSKSIFIFDEYPTPIRHKMKRKIPNWKIFLYKKVLKKIDAYVSISDELKTFFNQISPKKTFMMQVITDISKFDAVESINGENQKSKSICYVGNMELAKDNIDLIIRAFKYVAKNYPSMVLKFYGGTDASTQKYLNELVLSLNLENNVLFKGRVDSIEIPQVLRDAHILVSSQPNTIRAKGGFPTKLGEYVASETPAIFSDVGENSKYFKSMQHVFFVKPDSIEEYASTMVYVIENYKEAKEIAKRGKKELVEKYSHLSIGKDFLKFIKYL